MTTRKGFQRLFIVLAIAWVAGCLYCLWPRTVFEPLGASGFYEGPVVSNLLLWDRINDEPSNPQREQNQREFVIAHATDPDVVRNYMRRQSGMDVMGWHRVATVVWLRLAAIAFVPPATFYFLFFHVGRWIYRGFKEAPGTQPAGQ